MKFKIFDIVRLSKANGDWLMSGIVTETNDEYSIVDFLFQAAKVKNVHLTLAPRPKGLLHLRGKYSAAELNKLKAAWDIVVSKGAVFKTPSVGETP